MITIQWTSYNWVFLIEAYVDDWGTVYILLGKLRISVPKELEIWNLLRVTGS